jgi:hypothetical protein
MLSPKLPDPETPKAEEPPGPITDPFREKFGAVAEACVPAKGPNELEALELVEQLPELPLTPDGEFELCVLEELLQLNPFAKCIGVIPMTNIAVMAVIATVTNIGDFCILSLF